MRLPTVPGPSDVLAAVEGLRHGIGDALSLVPRVAAAVGSMEALVARVDALVTRVETVVDRADSALTALDATQATADAAITAVERTQGKADDAIAAVGRTTDRADAALARADGLIDRMAPLVGDYVEPLRAVAPSVRRLAETLEPHEVEAMVTLVDRLPTLVTHLDQDILPILASMDGVAPDLHDLLDTVQDLRQVVKGFPGSRLFRRRGAEEIAEEDEEEAREEAAAEA